MYIKCYENINKLLSFEKKAAWGIAPIYFAGYAIVLLGFELVRHIRGKKAAAVG